MEKALLLATWNQIHSSNSLLLIHVIIIILIIHITRSAGHDFLEVATALSKKNFAPQTKPNLLVMCTSQSPSKEWTNFHSLRTPRIMCLAGESLTMAQHFPFIVEVFHKLTSYFFSCQLMVPVTSPFQCCHAWWVTS
jgi:hypothetical protein